MRKSMLALLLAVSSLSGAASGQFISEIHPHPRRPHIRRPMLRPVSVERHAVTVRIRDGVARTTVRETFRNPNRMQLEGTFFFPLPEDAALGDFSMRMGDRMVKGEVLEKDKAAGIYQGIVQRRRDPALLEYVGRRLFKARVFPIPAGGVAEIELSYSETLRRDGKLLEFRYPFRTRGVVPMPVARASFKLSILSAEPIRTVYSPSHQVKVVKDGDHKASVSFKSKRAPADRDVVVVYGVSSRPVGASLFTHVETGQSDGRFLLLLAPAAESAGEIAAKDVVFVVDTSGSMAGDKLEQTRKALRYCIASLGKEDRFEIIPFATEAAPLFGRLADADAASRARAGTFVQEMAARGGTNIEEALVKALSLSHDKGRPFMIIFMTDGEPTIGITRPDDILKRVGNANEALTRLFVFGIGEDLNADLLDRLAEENHGARDYVGRQEDIELKVSSFFAKVSSPVLTDVSLAVDGIAVSDVYPKALPDLFRGTQMLVTGRFRGKGGAKVSLSGKVNGKAVTHAFDVRFDGGSKHTEFVPRLWAVRKVGYLMDQMRLNGVKDELKKEVVRLGKKYGIVTPYTSFLVVEDDVARGTGRWNRDRGRPGARPGLSGGRGAGGGRRAPARTSRGRAFGDDEDARGAPRPQTAGGARARRVQADEFLGGEAAKLSKSKAPATPGGGKKKADRPAEDRGGVGHVKDMDVEVKEARNEALDRLIDGYFTDSISVSRQLKRLREAASDSSGRAPLLVRRVSGRTFYNRSGFFVESSLLDLSKKQILAQLVKVEAFSPGWMKLAKGRPDLARVLALGDRILFRDKGRIVQIIPAAAKQAPAASRPGRQGR